MILIWRRLQFNQNILCRKACELHFKEEPIKIAYARGQYMYDENDNRYLDCVNNVTHGMCMPPLMYLEKF